MLNVHTPDPRSIRLQPADEVVADESAGPGNKDALLNAHCDSSFITRRICSGSQVVRSRNGNTVRRKGNRPTRTPLQSSETDLGTSRAVCTSARVEPRSNGIRFARSEEHTSELQSQSNLVCRLLLEKKK